MWLPKDNMKSLFSSTSTMVAVTSIVAATGSSAVTVLVMRRRIEAKYIEISNREIAEARRFYRRLNKHDEFATPEETVTALGSHEDPDTLARAGDALLSYSGEVSVSPSDDVVDQPEVVIKNTNQKTDYNRVKSSGKPSLESVVAHRNLNIFTEHRDEELEVDFDTEVAHRDEEIPYIISQEEFLQNEPEHDQITLTFFEEDEVLVDDKEVPLPYASEVCGPDNLKFGQWSKDKNIVYVRNHRLGSDFEILRSTGSFANDVLGFKHSDDGPKIRRMRQRDD